MFATALRSLRIIEVSAHCDLPCGVYDPAQARIEAESIKATIDKKVADSDDPDFRVRAAIIKEQRSELVKHHLWVLWTDYFKPRTSRSTPSCTPSSTRRPSSPVRPAPRAASTSPSPTSCSPRSTAIAEIFAETKKA
jgi:nickel superoxide dismutase